MKPTVTMDGKEMPTTVTMDGKEIPTTVTMDGKEMPTVIQPEMLASNQSKSRSRTRVVLLTACLVVLCACALSLGLYFGLRNKESMIFQQNHVYFRGSQGESVEVDLTVTQNEEIFSCVDATLVYDFSTGLMVYRSKRPGEENNGCLVKSFNMTEAQEPSEIKDKLQDDKVVGTTGLMEIRVTNVWLNEEALGTESRKLCAGKEIRFVEKAGLAGGMGEGADIDAEGRVEDGQQPNSRKRRWLRHILRFFRIARRIYKKYKKLDKDDDDDEDDEDDEDEKEAI